MAECSLCVRFILIDVPGAKDRKDDGKGYLKGAKYGAKVKGAKADNNIGKIPKKTAQKFKDLIKRVNGIWAQCSKADVDGESEDCPIKFYTCDPAVVALDPKGQEMRFVNDTASNIGGTDRKIFVPIDVVQKTPLEDFLEKGNPPEIEVNDGFKKVDVDQKIELSKKKNAKGKVTKKPKFDPSRVGMTEQELLKKIEEIEKKKHPVGKSIQPRSAHQAFGQVADRLLGEKCINIFVVGNVEDIEDESKEKGIADYKGRNIIIDMDRIETFGGVLAHELGHNVGLGKPHHPDENNLMHEKEGGRRLTPGQCEVACETAKSEELKDARLSGKALKKIQERDAKEAKAAADKEAKEAKKAAEKAEKEAEKKKRQARKQAIDEEVEKIKGELKKLKDEIAKAKEAAEEKVSDMKGLSKKQKANAVKGITESTAKEEIKRVGELKRRMKGLKTERSKL